MTSKAQELKTLEAIKKLVAELGEDSYIGMAFEGCFEIAEENIKNDFACSMKQRAEAAEDKAEGAKKRADAAEAALEAARNREAKLQKEIETYKKQAESAIDKAFKQELDLNDLREQIKANSQKQAVDDKDLEILKLKAKLYDMMNA